MFANAQDIEVKGFSLLGNDRTAVEAPRNDINGTPCGVVRVALKAGGAEFEGNVLGDVEFTGSEYLVYMASGSKRLGIKHPDYLPTTVVFDDYGTKKIASKSTYKLDLKASKTKAKVNTGKTGIAIFNITPSNALLVIDDQPVENIGGVYTASLPYGTHYYTVKYGDFSLNNLQVKIDKTPKNLNVDLTEYYAQVKVGSADDDAEIYINNEQRGLGSWSGMLAPGNYTIEARKGGYHALAQTVRLEEDEVFTLNFQAMKAISGALTVESGPAGSEVYLNGEKVGTTPWSDKNLAVGSYQLEVRREYYNPVIKHITINEDQQVVVNDELVLTQMGKIIRGAEQGNQFAIMMLAELYLKGFDEAIENENFGVFISTDIYSSDYYYINRDTFIKEKIKIDRDLDKFEYWFKNKAEDDVENDSYGSISVDKDGTINPLGENWIVSWRGLYEYAWFYYLCNGSPRSFYWLSKCAGGDEDDFWFAWHYYYGIGTAQNVDEAIKFLNRIYYYDNEQDKTIKYHTSSCNAEVLKRLGNVLFPEDANSYYQYYYEKYRQYINNYKP